MRTTILCLIAMVMFGCNNMDNTQGTVTTYQTYIPNVPNLTFRDQSAFDTVKSEDLFYAYKNPLRADEQFYRRYIVVKGEVSRIDRDNGTVYIDLNEQYMRVRCYMQDEDADKIAKLNMLSSITIKGVCIGKREVSYDGERLFDSSDPALVDCSILTVNY